MRALAQEAACLVLDEPTASLEFGNQALVLQQLRALAERDGLAVLMTTHHADPAFLVGDNCAILHRGALKDPAGRDASALPSCCSLQRMRRVLRAGLVLLLPGSGPPDRVVAPEKIGIRFPPLRQCFPMG